MSNLSDLCLGLAAATALVTSPATAQQRTGWGSEVSGFVAHQWAADLSGGGDVSTTRSLLGLGGLYTFDNGNSAGVALSFGQQSYDFGGGAAPLWNDINGLAISAPMQFQVGQSANVFIAPQIRRAYESGASTSDSTTYGVFAGVSWQMSDSLRIGPAFGAFSELEGSGINAFPAVIVDWDINDRWNLSTGSGLAATQGPGLQLSYAYSDALDIGLGVRLERAEFRLDDSGLAPGGVGEDQSIPVVLSVDYAPNPGFTVSGFVGAAFDGELTVENAAGARVSRQSYDTAPVAELAIRVRF
ncbi:hypothetical protein [Roseovarius sp. 2305UL8-3]|uniref:hypothetical protein n=1 Tax=Roseovarius conchicola TaxID=3121636 RepID=UPI0035296774